MNFPQIPKLPAPKELVPYFFVALISAGAAMWTRLGTKDVRCDARIQEAEKVWQYKFERQEARIDTANAVLSRVQAKQAETFQAYFEQLSKLTKKR